LLHERQQKRTVILQKVIHALSTPVTLPHQSLDSIGKQLQGFIGFVVVLLFFPPPQQQQEFTVIPEQCMITPAKLVKGCRNYAGTQTYAHTDANVPHKD